MSIKEVKISDLNLEDYQKSKLYNQLISSDINIAEYHDLDDVIDRMNLKSIFDNKRQNVSCYVYNNILYVTIDKSDERYIDRLTTQVKDAAGNTLDVCAINNKELGLTRLIVRDSVGNLCDTIGLSNTGMSVTGGIGGNYVTESVKVIHREFDFRRYDLVIPNQICNAFVELDSEMIFGNISIEDAEHTFNSLSSAISYIKHDNIQYPVDDAIDDAKIALTYLSEYDAYNNPMLTLLDDVTVNEVIYVDHNIVLNLNGHTLTIGESGSIRNHKCERRLTANNNNLISLTPNAFKHGEFDYNAYIVNGKIVYEGRPNNCGETATAAIDLYNCNDVVIYDVDFDFTFKSDALSHNIAASVDYGLKLSHSNVWMNTCKFNVTTMDTSGINNNLTVQNPYIIDVSGCTSTSILAGGNVKRIAPFFYFTAHDANGTQLFTGRDYSYSNGDTSFVYISNPLKTSSCTAAGTSAGFANNQTIGNINYYDGDVTLTSNAVGKIATLKLYCLSGYDSSYILNALDQLGYYPIQSACALCINTDIYGRGYSNCLNYPFEVKYGNLTEFRQNPQLMNTAVLTNVDINVDGNYDGPIQPLTMTYCNSKLRNTYVTADSKKYPTHYYNRAQRAYGIVSYYGAIHTQDCWSVNSYADIGETSNWLFGEGVLRDNNAGSAMTLSSSNMYLVNTEGHAVRDGVSGVSESHYVKPGSLLNKQNVRVPIHVTIGGFYTSSGHGGIYTTGSCSFIHDKNPEYYQTQDYHYSSGYTSSFVRPSKSIMFRDTAFGRYAAKNETAYTGASGSGYWGYGSYSWFDNCTLGLLRDESNKSGVGMTFNITGSIAIGETDVCYFLNPTLTFNSVTQSIKGYTHETKLCNERSVELITLNKDYKTQFGYKVPSKFCTTAPSKTGTSVSYETAATDGSITAILNMNGLYAPYTTETPIFDILLYRRDDTNLENPEILFNHEQLEDTYVEGTISKVEHYLDNTFEINGLYPGDIIMLQHQIHSDENDETVYTNANIKFVSNGKTSQVINLWDAIDHNCKYMPNGVVNIHTSANYKQGITNPMYGQYIKDTYIDATYFGYIDNEGIRHDVTPPTRSTGFISNSRLFGPAAFRNDYLSRIYIGKGNTYGNTIRTCTNDFTELCKTNPDSTISQKPNSANETIKVDETKNYRRKLPDWKFYHEAK